MTPAGDEEGLGGIRATFAGVSDQEVGRAILEDAAIVLRDIARSPVPSLHLRARAQRAARQVEALRGGLLDELREETLAQLAQPLYASATELDDGNASQDRRHLVGPEGIRHAVSRSRGTLCGLPAAAVEVLRSPFVAGRLDACPACSDLARG